MLSYLKRAHNSRKTIINTTVKLVLSRYSKIDKTKVFMANGSLMKVKSIAECSIGAFCNTFDLHLAIIGLEKQYLVFFLSGRLRQVFTVYELFTCCSCKSSDNGRTLL